MRNLSVRTMLALAVFLLSFAAGASPFPRLDQFGKSLDLTPVQQAQFDLAIAATQRVIIAAALDGMVMKSMAQSELAKPRPDLEALARAREDSAARLKPLHDAARVEWLRLYALLGDDQVEVVKAFLEARLGQMEALQKLLMSLLLGKAAAPVY